MNAILFVCLCFQVEFLWQMVLQMLDLLASRRTVDTVAGADEGKHPGGGGKNAFDNTLDFGSLDTIGEGRNIDLREDEDQGADESKRKAFRYDINFVCTVSVL